MTNLLDHWDHRWAAEEAQSIKVVQISSALTCEADGVLIRVHLEPVGARFVSAALRCPEQHQLRLWQQLAVVQL